jgi:hypothetical protein
MSKEFNENPFLKDTPIVPFSNGTEAMVYSEMNCQNCINYESESTSEEEEKCKLAFYLDLGNISGDIPLCVAKGIGCEYDPLYGRVRFNKKCREFRDGSELF